MGSKPATTTQTNSVQLSPEQQQLFGQAMPFIQQYAQSPLPTLPTNTIAGFNPNETQAQQGAINAATGPGQALGNQAAATNSFLLNPALLSPDSNPYLQAQGNQLAQTNNQNFTEQVLPALRSGASMTSGPYAGGNTKSGIAEGLASSRNSQATGNALTSLYSNAYGQGLGAMGQAVGQTPLTQNSLLFGANVQGQVGGQQRALDQAQLDQQNQLQLLQQQLPFLRAQDLISLMQGMPGSTGVSSVTGAQPGTSPIQGALGGAASGAALGSMIPGIGTAFGGLGGGAAGLLQALLSR